MALTSSDALVISALAVFIVIRTIENLSAHVDMYNCYYCVVFDVFMASLAGVLSKWEAGYGRVIFFNILRRWIPYGLWPIILTGKPDL